MLELELKMKTEVERKPIPSEPELESEPEPEPEREPEPEPARELWIFEVEDSSEILVGEKGLRFRSFGCLRIGTNDTNLARSLRPRFFFIAFLIFRASRFYCLGLQQLRTERNINAREKRKLVIS
ncbi:hypothetical protein SLE2022_274740 [Rubroshorea leprosula]